ncbi:MAG: type II toxin-antitoxin system Phd/YefM family antitoxin, partial [Chloroflexi bacterium]|nr:type II toxin-antitoxin system Phd/YefM family antitoxin [Chloroflexota bacterium]
MPKVRVVPVSEARPRLTSLIEEVSQCHEPCFIASHSKVKAVLMGLEDYDALIERLEDLEDSLEMQPKTGNMQRPANSVPTRRSELFARPAVAPHIVPKSGCDSPPL